MGGRHLLVGLAVVEKQLDTWDLCGLVAQLEAATLPDPPIRVVEGTTVQASALSPVGG
jgi:hypothetical protein